MYRCFPEIETKSLPVNGGDYFGRHPGMGDQCAVQRGSAPGLTTQTECGIEETVLTVERFHV